LITSGNELREQKLVGSGDDNGDDNDEAAAAVAVTQLMVH